MDRIKIAPSEISWFLLGIMTDIVLIILAGLLGGVIARLLHQPLILGYIIAGVLVGPHTGGATVIDTQSVEQLADIGVALLLFSLGLEFSKKDIRSIKGIAIYGTLIQVGLTIVCGYLLTRYLGWNNSSSLWFGLSIASSSTAVIMKTLISRGNMNTLSGKLMMGMSIVQDMSLIPLMILLLQLNRQEGVSIIGVGKPIVYAGGFILMMHVFGSKIAPRLLLFIARWNSRELFSLAVVAIGLGVGLVSNSLGLSFAFGAFVAGLVLSDSDYGHKALTELVPLRDIFGLLFFVSIGMLLDVRFLVDHLDDVLFLFVLGAGLRGLILAMTGWFFGYRRVVPIAMFFGMLAISEIAFVLIRTGLQTGSLGEYEYALILNTVVVSMLVGPVASGLTTPFYNFVRKHISHNFKVKNISIVTDPLTDHVIITGDEGAVRSIGVVLRRVSLPYIIIEPNHNVYRQLKHSHLNVIYGDPTRENILASAGISRCRIFLVMSTDTEQRDEVVHRVQTSHPSAQIITRVETLEEMRKIRREDWIEVIHPDFEAAFEIAHQVLARLGVSGADIQNYLTAARRELYAEPDRLKLPALDLMDHLDRATHLLAPVWFVVPRNSSFIGKSLGQIRIRYIYNVTIVGVMRKDGFIQNPGRNFFLEERDLLAIIGQPKDCERFVQAMK